MEEERRLTWNTILSTLFYINLVYIVFLAIIDCNINFNDRLYFVLLVTFHCFILRVQQNYTNKVFDQNKSLDEHDKKDIFTKLITIIIISVIFIVIQFYMLSDLINNSTT